MSKIVIIGGCGRLGLKLALISACNGHYVSSVDIDEERINEIKNGCLPFIEPNAEAYLEQALKNKSLNLGMEYTPVSEANIVIITIGTPVDSNLNPSLEPVAGVIFDLSEYFRKNQLIIFRNNLSPSILNRIKTLIEDKTGFKVGDSIYLAFAPEMPHDGAEIQNLSNLPQAIGAYDEKSFKLAENFFKTITKGKITWVTPEEAILSKLMNNMFVNIQRAVSNEFYLIAETFNANIHNILSSLAPPISRLLPPNPNSSGPGMHKEGWFLVERTPFTDLITTAFKINESMPAYLVQKLEKYKINKVAILGMTNKANSDDPRSSLGYKLRKLLFYKDYNVSCYDPYLPEYSDSSSLHKSDAVILMTPHKEFTDLNHIMKLINNPNCIIIDIQGFWKETREQGQNGIFKYNFSQEKVKTSEIK